MSERCACRLVGQPRSTQRYCAKSPGAQEQALVKRLHELSERYPRYGYRRITVMLKREGWAVNRKRVQRLWRQEGLRILSRPRKRRRLGHGDNSCARRRPTHPHHVWTTDFAADRTEGGQMLRVLAVVDEWTRQCLRLEVRRSWVAGEVRAVLASAMEQYGVPEHLRCDNGTEYTAHAVRSALGQVGVETLYIEPGSPWQNGYGESFIARLRDEQLGENCYRSLLEARVLLARWQKEYNEERPHSSLDDLPPAVFAALQSGAGSATLRRLPTGANTETCVSAAGT